MRYGGFWIAILLTPAAGQAQGPFDVLERDRQGFLGIDSLEVQVWVDDDAKRVVDQYRIRQKFEVVLRKYRVPIVKESSPWLTLTMDSTWIDLSSGASMCAFNIRVELEEVLSYYREGERYWKVVPIWSKGIIGVAGKNVAEEAFDDRRFFHEHILLPVSAGMYGWFVVTLRIRSLPLYRLPGWAGYPIHNIR